MANPEHVWVIRQGVEAWNAWRRANPGTPPDLSQLDFRWADLGLADLSEVDLSHAGLSDASLRNANLAAARAPEANFSRADLSRADAAGADLSRADLRGARLARADLGRACLRGANLTGADLSAANLNAADLRWADLSAARLCRSDLRFADLINVDLTRADLTQANLSRANLRRANFNGARAGGTHFDGTDLSSTRSLEAVVHLGPSFVDMRTIYRSKGLLPGPFLYGCGVPDALVAYAQRLAADPLPFPACAISCAERDEPFARRLAADLHAQGLRCWPASENAKMTGDWQAYVEEVVRSHDKLLLVLSVASVKSTWIAHELAAVLAREAEERPAQVLVPLRLDEAIVDATEAWAADVRRYHTVLDFRAWRDATAYGRSLEQLLGVLGAAKAAPTAAR